MHALRRGVPSPEQAHAAYSHHAHARLAQVPRRAAGPAPGAALDSSVQRAHVSLYARGGIPHRARHRACGARECGALQVLWQELSRRVLAHSTLARAHRGQAVQVRVLRESV